MQSVHYGVVHSLPRGHSQPWALSLHPRPSCRTEEGRNIDLLEPPSAVYLTSKWSTRGMSSPTLLAPRGSTCEVRCLLYGTPSETRVGRNEGLWGPGRAGAPVAGAMEATVAPRCFPVREALGGAVAAAVAGEDLHEQVVSTQERGKAKQI